MFVEEEIIENAKSDLYEKNVLVIEHLHKAFGNNHVLVDFNMVLRKGENLVVLGKSGCGKSVLIKCIIGLLKPDRGKIEMFGRDVPELGQEELDKLRVKVGFLFQSNALYDSMTVRENLEFPLRRRELLGEEPAPRSGVADRWADGPGRRCADGSGRAFDGVDRQQVRGRRPEPRAPREHRRRVRAGTTGAADAARQRPDGRRRLGGRRVHRADQPHGHVADAPLARPGDDPGPRGHDGRERLLGERRPV